MEQSCISVLFFSETQEAISHVFRKTIRYIPLNSAKYSKREPPDTAVAFAAEIWLCVKP